MLALIFQVIIFPLLVSLYETKGFIGGDPVQPGKQAAFLFKLSNISVYLYKGILQNVICIIVIQYHSPDIPVQLFLVFFHQSTKTSFQTA